MVVAFGWLLQEGPKARKHFDVRHALSVVLVHYTVVTLVACWVHDALLRWALSLAKESSFFACSSRDEEIITNNSNPWLPYFLILYSAWFLPWRWIHFPIDRRLRGSVLYEFTWLCNVTLVVSAWALYTNRPVLASAFCVSIGIDQLLWYVDLAGCAVTAGTWFPIGVCQYVFRKDDQTTWATRITCTHHLWTIPLITWSATRGIHPLSWPLSLVLTVVNATLSRCLVPRHIECDSNEKKKNDNDNENNGKTTTVIIQKYLNVNLGHELWPDIRMRWLQINHGSPTAAVYLGRLLSRWLAFQTMVFLLLYTGFTLGRPDWQPQC